MMRVRNNFDLRMKGQVSIFVILAVVLVSVIILLIALRSRTPLPTVVGTNYDPESFIDECVQTQTTNLLEILLPQAGLVNYSDSVMYNGTPVPYLCKNVNYYEPCVNQQPLLIKKVHETLEANLKLRVGECISQLTSELNDKGYSIEGGLNDLNVDLRSGIVIITTNTDMTISKGDITSKYTGFVSRVRTPLFDLLKVAQEIASQEARFCYFSNDGFSLLYREFDIRKNILPDTTKIYRITYVQTGESMYAAVRGCAVPAGF